MVNSVPHETCFKITVVCICPGRFETVRIDNPFEWHQLTILAAKRMTVACCEVRERHLVGATNCGIHVVNLAGETMWWKPLGHCVGVQERSVHTLGFCAKHAVKSDGSCGHDQFTFRFAVQWVGLYFAWEP